jgi:hypothetical protein
MRLVDRILRLWFQWNADVRACCLPEMLTGRHTHLLSQRDVRTIEGDLFKALIKSGAVSQDNADDPVKVQPSSP